LLPCTSLGDIVLTKEFTSYQTCELSSFFSSTSDERDLPFLIFDRASQQRSHQDSAFYSGDDNTDIFNIEIEATPYTKNSIILFFLFIYLFIFFKETSDWIEQFISRLYFISVNYVFSLVEIVSRTTYRWENNLDRARALGNKLINHYSWKRSSLSWSSSWSSSRHHRYCNSWYYLISLVKITRKGRPLLAMTALSSPAEFSCRSLGSFSIRSILLRFSCAIPIENREPNHAEGSASVQLYEAASLHSVA